MSLVLPTAAPTAEGWTIRAYLGPLSLSTGPAAGGSCRLEFQQLAHDRQWLVDRAVVSCTSSAPTSLRLYSGAEAVSRLLSGSDRGNFDEAEYPPSGILVESGSYLVAVWSGADDGAVGTLNVQVRELQRTAG